MFERGVVITRDVPEKYRRLYARAMAGRSQSAAIRSFCLECVGYDHDEVKNCTDTTCPLYPYRLTGRKVPRASEPPRRFSPGRAGREQTSVESTNAVDGASVAEPGQKASRGA